MLRIFLYRRSLHGSRFKSIENLVKANSAYAEFHCVFSLAVEIFAEIYGAHGDEKKLHLFHSEKEEIKSEHHVYFAPASIVPVPML